jgi:hypothetical protein
MSDAAAALYLLHDVFPAVDHDGPLCSRKRLHTSEPSLSAALKECSAAVSAMCSAGNLEALHELLAELMPTELAELDVSPAFVSSCLRGHLSCAEYLLRRGYVPPRATLASLPGQLLREQLDADIESEESGAPSAASSSAAELLTAARHAFEQECSAVAHVILGAPLPPSASIPPSFSSAGVLVFCCARLGISLELPRGGDGYTLLHLAALNGMLPLLLSLLACMSSASLCAADGSSPLDCAALGAGDNARTDESAVRYDAVLLALHEHISSPARSATVSALAAFSASSEGALRNARYPV